MHSIVPRIPYVYAWAQQEDDFFLNRRKILKARPIRTDQKLIEQTVCLYGCGETLRNTNRSGCNRFLRAGHSIHR